MPTIITHAVAAAALVAAFPASRVPRRLAVLGGGCAMVPDLDVLGLAFGVKYADLLGHRGLSHSLIFAAVVAGLALLCVRPASAPWASRGLIWLYLFLATASHGFLDAFTDGGLGVAFFSPFDPTRYFFPWTPIEVSAIGGRFFSRESWPVVGSEFRWVWLPALAFVLLAWTTRRLLARKALQTTG